MTLRTVGLACCLAFAAACSKDGAPKFSGEPSEPAVTYGSCSFCHQALAAHMTATGGHESLDLKCEFCHEDLLPGNAGPGHRSVPACTDSGCHATQMTHQPAEPGTQQECVVCHTPHGSTNFFLVREEIETPQGGSSQVEFTNEQGRADGSFASLTQPGSGICEICHTQTDYYRRDGTGDPHFTFTCTTCHQHAAGFLSPPTDTPTETPTITPTPVATATPSIGPSQTPTPTGVAAIFATSLHFLRTGKETFYSASNGGFETLTNVPYDSLACRNCHAANYADGTPIDGDTYVPSCRDCHANPDDPSAGISDALCFGCHSRQAAERGLFPDVHRDAGFTCMSCHQIDEMHGNGTPYTSLLESPGPDCLNCHSAGHVPGPIPSNTAHSIHTTKVHCSSCHVKSVITCYNCHFDSEVAGAGKRYLSPPRGDFKMLVNFSGLVRPATFQALVFQGESFYTIAPYYAHTITSSVSCGDCHNNAAVNEYKTSGNITVTEYVGDQLQGPTGVIPIPQDWQTALKLDFLDYTGDPSTPIDQTDPALWKFLKSGADLDQMLFGEPLTERQMNSLALPVGG